MVRKALILAFAVVCIVYNLTAQTEVVSYNFDSSDDGWTVTTNTNGNWLRGVDIFSSGSIDSYWYTSPSDYGDNAVLVIESPTIDLTGRSDMIVSMRVRYNTEVDFDGLQVQYSDDGGSNWNVLGAFGDGINWYNDTDVDAIANGADGWSGDNTTWETAQVEVPAALENNATAKFRVRFLSDLNTTDVGVAFDEFEVFEGAEIEVAGNDNEIISGDATPSVYNDTDFGNVDLASPRSKTYTIANIGGGTLSLSGTPTVSISGTNAADFTVTSQPVSTSLNALTSTTFTIEFDPSANGVRTATVSITNNDTNESTYTFDIQGKGVDAIVNHDFDTGNNGWALNAGSTNGTWTRGTGIFSAGADGSYWHTTPTTGHNNNASMIVTSSVIDLTGETDMVLLIDVRYDVENGYDGFKIEYSDDGGSTWNDLGSYNPGVSNWYNNSDVDVFADDEDAWSNDNGAWETAGVALPAALENNASARFRVLFQSDGVGTVGDEIGAAFDNFMIITNGIPDIYVEGNGLEIVDGDGSPNGLDDTDFRNVDITTGTRRKFFTVTNLGGSLLTFGGTPVTITGSTDFTVNTQLPTTLDAYESATFVIEFDPSSSGTKNATVSIDSDDPDEDPYTFSIRGIGDDALYYQTFEAGEEGWSASLSNANGDWVRGTGILSTGADGTYWHTSPTGNYSANANLIVTSGTFDFTGATSLTLYMDVRYECEQDYDGYHVEYSPNGGTNWYELGSVGEGLNWYNDNTIESLGDINGWSGNNFNWETAEYDLPLTLEDNANVQFRVTFASDVGEQEIGVAFDNVIVFSNVVPLPVELLYFSGKLHDNNILLSWSTSTELNNDYFEVLRSNDGHHFQVIGSVDGNGNSSEVIDYSFVDRNPFQGMNFYRLRQVDFDGTSEEFEIIMIEYERTSSGMDPLQGGSLFIYPNPPNGQDVNFSFDVIDRELPYEIEITTLDGKRLYHRMSLDYSNLVINSELIAKSGIYLITLKHGDQVSMKRLLIR